MCIKVSAGTAYVKGYDIDLVGSTVIDVPKPRTTKEVKSARVPFAMGSLLKVNNVTGVPFINIGAAVSGTQTTQVNVVQLFNRLRNTGTTNAGTGLKIGEARLYWYGVSDAPYTGDTTEWDLYLFDVQTYTDLYLAKSYSLSEVPLGSYVRGLSSDATGYVAAKRNGAGFSLTQTSGNFLVGEQVIINENQDYKVAIENLRAFSVEDIKSVYQDSTSINTAIQRDFIADCVLYERTPPKFAITDKLVVSGANTGQVAGRSFSAITGIKTDAVIKYQTGNADANFNRISSIAADGTTIGLATPASSVTGIYRNNVTNGSSPVLTDGSKDSQYTGWSVCRTSRT